MIGGAWKRESRAIIFACIDSRERLQGCLEFRDNTRLRDK